MIRSLEFTGGGTPTWVTSYPKVKPAKARAAEPRTARRGRIAAESAEATAEHVRGAGARRDKDPGSAAEGPNATAGAAATSGLFKRITR